ncbi:conserved membrane protein of unknown function [Methylotuvimicrobium alcaliphilum 20Z]|uniref:SSD domain-containing protein n=2 Tax=Methylotuvimicrobium alcaliphilum TaxID=271065 RepID=G4SZG1_META2|nr:conserved membrane protein of unknown function [Methylotuvimicrobium alcaliphilum 20Z]
MHNLANLKQQIIYMPWKSVSHRLSHWVTYYPWRVLLLVFSVVVALSSGAMNLGFNSDSRVYFSKENPRLLAFEALEAVYNRTDSVFFVIQPPNDSIFNLSSLQAIAQLTQAAWQLPYSSRVDSIVNFQHSYSDNENIIIADLIPDPKALTETEILSIKKTALNEPLLVNRLVSVNGHVAGVNVNVHLPGKSPMESIRLAERARKLAGEIESQYPGVKIRISGIAMMSNAFVEVAMSDNLKLLPLMYSVIIGVLWLSLRSLSATFAVVLLIMLAMASALGTFGWFHGHLTPTSAVAPTIIMTVAVADCLHVLLAIRQNMEAGQEKKQAIQESLHSNFQPILLTSVSTMLGFLGMNFSEAPPFRDFGNIVATGVAAALFLTLTLLPSLITLLPIRPRLKQQRTERPMHHLAIFVIRYRKALLPINGLLAMILIGYAPDNELNDEFVNYFGKSIEFRQDTDFLSQHLGGIYTIEYSLDTQQEGGVQEPVFLRNLDRFNDWLKKQPETVHVNTVTDIFKRLNKNMHDDDPKYYALPDRRELASQYLLMYELSLPYGLDLNDQINADKSGTRVIVTLKNLSSKQMLAFESRSKAWLKTDMPETSIETGSTALMFAHVGQRNIRSMITGTLLVLVFISFILIGAFRSLSLGLISIIPNLTPSIAAFGIWALIDGRVGLSLSVVASITLGIVVDDTIHFISKYRHARLEKNYGCREAIRHAFSTVGEAIWITSAVLICGFIVLSFSPFTINSEMGLMTAITLTIALFLDLLLLPPLLMLWDGDANNRK